MSPLGWGLLAAAGGVAVVDWRAVAGGTRRIEYVCKPATLSLLVVLAVVLDPVSPARRWWFVGGLTASLVGDVLLMLPADLFLGGLGAFLVAHVAYVVGIDLRPGTVVALLVATLATAAVAGPIARGIVQALVRARRRHLVGPVVVYMLTISAMVVSALASGNAWLAAGAVSFYASDAMLGWDRFVASWPRARLAVIVTYHLGQAGLVLALVR